MGFSDDSVNELGANLGVMSPVVIHPDFDHVHFLSRKLLHLVMDVFDCIHFARHSRVSRQHGWVSVPSGEAPAGSKHGGTDRLIFLGRAADFEHRLKVSAQAQHRSHAIAGILLEVSQDIFFGIIVTLRLEPFCHAHVTVRID
jgi:hypothetical protein